MRALVARETERGYRTPAERHRHLYPVRRQHHVERLHVVAALPEQADALK